MTQHHRSHNYTLSDVDLSLVSIVCPHALLLVREGRQMFGSLLSRTGWIQEPTGARTGATGEIGIVLMAPEAPRNMAAKC